MPWGWTAMAGGDEFSLLTMAVDLGLWTVVLEGACPRAVLALGAMGSRNRALGAPSEEQVECAQVPASPSGIPRADWPLIDLTPRFK